MEIEGEELRKLLLQMQAQICQTLADPTRLELLYLLGEGERSVKDLVELTGLRQSNISQHLALMRERGLVVARRSGNSVYYSLANRKILEACKLTREILLERLRRERVLSSLSGLEGASKEPTKAVSFTHNDGEMGTRGGRS